MLSVSKHILIRTSKEVFTERLPFSTSSVKYACNRVGYSRILGRQYLRVYPTLLVNPDGSTATIRYKEPRQIITLPLNLKEADEATRTERLALRKRSKKVEMVEEDVEDTFDAREYRHLWQGKKKLGGKG